MSRDKGSGRFIGKISNKIRYGNYSKNKALNLLNKLVDIDWCIGYELTENQYIELDRLRTEVFQFLKDCKYYD